MKVVEVIGHGFAFLVSQILSEGFAPVSAFRRVSKVLFSRANRLAIGRHQLV
jgi:hypothetical protein